MHFPKYCGKFGNERIRVEYLLNKVVLREYLRELDSKWSIKYLIVSGILVLEAEA